jgi:RNA polymerase sigma factor (sigma-70 family)
VSRYSGVVLGQLDRIFNLGTVVGLDDDLLLKRFVAERDELAFAALVARHARMVLDVCRRVLRDEHEVEDAFQATFLVLASRAKVIRKGGLLGHWIYGVARRVAVRARAHAAARYVHERNATARNWVELPSCEDERRELMAVVDDELAHLPGLLRAPMVLCYLEGLTHDEAAGRLGFPVGTVRSRLARARETLRRRLSRRGLTVDDAALTATLASQPVSSLIIDATVRTTLGFTTRAATATALASATASALAKGVLHAMTFSKLKLLGAAALACVLALGGTQTYALQFGGSGRPGAAARKRQAGEREQTLLRAMAKIQNDLAESARINAQLQKEPNDLRAELESLRQPAGKTARRADSSPPPTPLSAQQTGGPGGRLGGGMGGVGGVGGGIMGGMVMRASGAKERAHYIQTDPLILVSSPEGDIVTAYSTATGKAKSLRLARAGDAKLEVAPILSGGLAALYLAGPNVTRIAALSFGDEIWYVQELRQPVEKAMPTVSQNLAAYGLGRRIYAFSAVAKRWDVLELPERAIAGPFVGDTAITCEHNGHLYVFSTTVGKWHDIDTRAALDDQDGEKAAK